MICQPSAVAALMWSNQPATFTNQRPDRTGPSAACRCSHEVLQELELVWQCQVVLISIQLCLLPIVW